MKPASPFRLPRLYPGIGRACARAQGVGRTAGSRYTSSPSAHTRLTRRHHRPHEAEVDPAAPEETMMNRSLRRALLRPQPERPPSRYVGTTAYRAGLARGLADAGSVPGPWLYHGPFWYSGPFAFLFPLLGLFLILAVVRGLFWRGRCASGRGSWKRSSTDVRGVASSGPPVAAARRIRPLISTQINPAHLWSQPSTTRD